MNTVRRPPDAAVFDAVFVFEVDYQPLGQQTSAER
jgi:hypothetical protein